MLKLNKEDKNKYLESSLSFEDNISLFEKEKKLFNITVNIDENFLLTCNILLQDNSIDSMG